jgi:hypothetical protein
MQEFVNKQLPGSMQEVAFGLSTLPPPPSILTLEQIQEVFREEQPKEYPFLEQAQRKRKGR